MFGCFFTLDNGTGKHYPGQDFASESEAIHYAEQSLMVSPGYAKATITHQGFPILEVNG